MFEIFRKCCVPALLAAQLWVGPAFAATLQVRVVGPDGQPVPEVAVFVQQSGVDSSKPVAAIMDQRDKRFVPHILVVQKGAAVSFPNSDVVAHHVYSFSKLNRFVLPLYKGTPPEPVVLDHDGIVTLGCNIHDGMLGYIVVVDTDEFAKTNYDGGVKLTIDDSAHSYTVNIWSPRIRDAKGHLVQTLPGDAPGEMIFALEKKLRPAHIDRSESMSWDEY
ncbi:MAG: methylamine utilization protein [Gammaproteobacteria bacterium]|nr:methylamine utilization protein [Gammaproteobacteria bacterium]